MNENEIKNTENEDLEVESLNEVPENWEEHTPGTNQAANVIKESMIANLQAMIKEIEDADASKLHSMILVYDYEKDEPGVYETALRRVGESTAAMNLALVFLTAVGHQLIKDQPAGDLSPKDLERGLGGTIVKSIIDSYNLTDDDLDLNELKVDYSDIMTVEDAEAQKEIDEKTDEIFTKIDDTPKSVDQKSLSEDEMFKSLD